MSSSQTFLSHSSTDATPVFLCVCGIPKLRRRVGLVVVVFGVHLASPFRCCVMILPLFTGVVAAWLDLRLGESVDKMHTKPFTKELLSASPLLRHNEPVREIAGCGGLTRPHGTTTLPSVIWIGFTNGVFHFQSISGYIGFTKGVFQFQSESFLEGVH